MTQSIGNVVVVGAGTMGHGIAQVCAMAGFQTTLVDDNNEKAKEAVIKIIDNLSKGLEKKKISEQQKNNALENLRLSSSLDVVRECDLMIEAIFEQLDVKQQIFAKADKMAPAHAILATNTSSLSVADIAHATKRPEQIVGLHFFNPAHIMQLLEIVRTDFTSATTLQAAGEFAKTIQKTSIIVKDSPGFATSRLGICFALEAMRMLEQGVAKAEEIDRAMVLGYGHPMGPLELSDLVGLDVRLAIAEYLFKTLKSECFRPPELLKNLVAKKHFGKKSGQGFYAWQGDVKFLG